MVLEANERELWIIMTTFPEMHIILNVIVVLLNILIAGTSLSPHSLFVGTGTIVMALFGGKTLSKIHLAIGILQLATMWIIVGTIWSIAWAVLIIWKKVRAEASPPNQAAVAMLNDPKASKDIPEV